MDFSGDVVSCVAGAEMSDPQQGQGIVIREFCPVVFLFPHPPFNQRWFLRQL